MSLLDPVRGERAAHHTAARFGWSSPSATPAAVTICAAAVAVVVEAWHYLRETPFDLQLGTIPISPSIVPVLVIVAVGGGRLLGQARSSDSAKAFWVLVTMVLVVITTSVDGIGLANSAGLVLAALSEELVYRLAGPAVVAFGLARAGVSYRRSLTTGYIVAGTLFIVLPGHVAQWDAGASAAPYIAFTVLATLAVHRSGAVLEIGLLHCAVNMVNLGRMTGAIGTSGAVMVGALLALLVIGYIPTARRPWEHDLIIDITGEEPMVTRRSPWDRLRAAVRREVTDAHAAGSLGDVAYATSSGSVADSAHGRATRESGRTGSAAGHQDLTRRRRS